MLSILLLLADRPADVGSGAVLTLALPLGLALVAFLVWYLVLRHRTRGD
jgi:hypothetical protein